MIRADFDGIVEVDKKWLSSGWEKEVGKKAVFRTAQTLEDEGIKNLEQRTYNGRERAHKLNGWLKNGWKNKESDNGMTRKVISNPQFAGASFNYGPAMDTGRKEIVPRKKRILAAPVSRFNVGSIFPADSKKFPKLSKNGKFVLIGKKVKAFKGNRYFQDAIKTTKSKANEILQDAFQKFKPK
jgi:hypothetical protein